MAGGTGAALAGLTGVLVVAVLGGCGSARDDAAATGTNTTRSTASPTESGEEASMRKTLVAALGNASPSIADLAQNERTTITAANLPEGSTWQVLDLVNRGVQRPVRAFVALSNGGEAKVLTGKPENFAVVAQAVPVKTAGDATLVAQVFLDSTRSMSSLSYRVDSTDDIRWRPRLDAAGEKARDTLRATVGRQIAAPRAESADGAWTVTLWTVTGQDLVRHQVTLGGSAGIADSAKTIASDLPVVIGV